MSLSPWMHVPPQQRGRGAARRASVLILVLVVLSLLSLGAYTFSEFMIVEAQATAAYGREVQARAAADSAVEQAASLLTGRYLPSPPAYYDHPELFRGVPLSASASGASRFSIVAPVEADLSGQSVRFGLIDESAKLNLNTAIAAGLSDDDLLALLMSIPQMQPDVAEAILDYVDTDQTPRQMGAENEYYLTLSPPYEAKNAPLESLDELLLVRGVTPALLYGEDANRNGLLDPNENDGDASLPLDNADGVLQHGLSAYLTVFSAEINRNSLGEPRINVNLESLADLYDQVQAAFDEDTARFIIGYRISGASTQAAGGGTGGGGGTGPGTGTGGGTGGGSSSGGGGSSGSRSGSTGGSSGSSGGSSSLAGNGASSGGNTGGSSTAGARQTTSGQGTNPSNRISSQQVTSGEATVTRGGIDVTNGGKVNITSLYSLFGASTRVPVKGQLMTLKSPWMSDPDGMRSSLPTVMDKLTVSGQPFIAGRININLARRELLMGLPGMTDTLADGIMAGQTGAATGQSSSQSTDQSNTGWLVTSGLTDLTTLQKLDPLIGARGDVFRLQAVGYSDRGGPVVRIEAVIDATQDPPHVLSLRDLTELGRGFPATLLGASGGR